MEDVQATAKWANRVLRPLTSIYRRIEKHQEPLSTIATESKRREAAKHNGLLPLDTAKLAQRAHGHLGSDADADERDPAWVPGKNPERRRSRHKYSSRGEDGGTQRRNRLSVHSPEARRILPGAIEVATPLITGKRWELPSSAQSQRSTGPANPHNYPPPSPAFRVRNPLQKSSWQVLLDQSGDLGFADIAHNLDRVFQNFLFNTQNSKREAKPSTDGNRCGARSLLLMAARRLPTFIAREQEAQAKLDEHGDEDMCDAYFTELEAFYAPQGKGWKPLREAARAQGIHLVATMIQNNWVTEPIACALIEKCHSIAPEESNLLLSILLSTRKNYPYPQALRPAIDFDRPVDPVRLLRKFTRADIPDCSYVFDELGKLLLRGVLPPEWMATNLWKIWMTRATISLSKEDHHCYAASRLIEAVVLSASDTHLAVTPAASRNSNSKLAVKGKDACARETRAASSTAWNNPHLVRPCPMQVEDALSNHVISLLTAVCGMHISRSHTSEHTECKNSTKASHIISYLRFALQRAVDSEIPAQRSDIAPHQLLRRGCVLLAASLVQCNDTLLLDDAKSTMASTPNIDECADVIASRPDMIRELALFVRQAIRCLRKSSVDETEHTSGEIRRMVSQLARIADAPGLSALLGRVAAEAAMEFAEATGDPDEHVWAVEIQETVVTRQNEKERNRVSSESSETFEGPVESGQTNGLFRWEDSIGEWVAPTPVSKKKPIIAQRAQRPPRMLSSPEPCVPCSTDCSSPGSDCPQDSASSVHSSPSVATKRTFEDIDIPRLRPSKRPRPTPVVVIDEEKGSPRETSPTPTRLNPTVESTTRILRERSINLTRRAAPTTRQARKVEVVIFNKKEDSSSKDVVRPIPERVEKQMHRTMERKRPARTSSFMPRTVERRTSQRTVIHCPHDSDSDDELSFL
jgi:hypothetical protein